MKRSLGDTMRACGVRKRNLYDDLPENIARMMKS